MCSERHKMLPVRGERACVWMVRSNKPSERKHTLQSVQGDFLKTLMGTCSSPAWNLQLIPVTHGILKCISPKTRQNKILTYLQGSGSLCGILLLPVIPGSPCFSLLATPPPNSAWNPLSHIQCLASSTVIIWWKNLISQDRVSTYGKVSLEHYARKKKKKNNTELDSFWARKC